MCHLEGLSTNECQEVVYSHGCFISQIGNSLKSLQIKYKVHIWVSQNPNVIFGGALLYSSF